MRSTIEGLENGNTSITSIDSLYMSLVTALDEFREMNSQYKVISA